MKKIIFLLAIVTFAVYFNSLGHSFVWDDRMAVIDNELITHIMYLPKIFSRDLYYSHAEKYTAEHSNYYRPVQTLTYLIDYHIWKLNPFGFHLTNILLHLANGILVFLAVFMVCKSRIASLFTSILFIVHPVQTGAVDYVAGRSDILACLFILISFFLYGIDCVIAPEDKLANMHSKPDSVHNRIAGRKKLFYPFSVLAFVLALLSKEAVLIFPLLLIVYDAAYGRRVGLRPIEGKGPLEFIKRYSAYLIVAAIYAGLRVSLLNFTPEKKLFYSLPDIYARLLTMCRVLMSYIGLLIFPANLHMEREVPLAASVLEGRTLIYLLGTALFITLIFIAYKKSRTIFFGLAWFLIFLIPFANIVPMSALMAEHWLYIPSIGFFLALSIMLVKLQSLRINFKYVSALFIATVLFYSGRTVVRNMDWKDDISIYSSTLKASPKNTKICYNIGAAYESAGNLPEAEKFYRRAIENGMGSAEVYTNLGILYIKLNDLEKPEACLKKALELNPFQPFAHNGLGSLYEKRGMFDEAIFEYKKAVECLPAFYDAHVSLGVLYDGQGRLSEAIEHFEKALALRKDKISYHNLGKAYYNSGNIDKALEVWKEGNIDCSAVKQ